MPPTPRQHVAVSSPDLPSQGRCTNHYLKVGWAVLKRSPPRNKKKSARYPPPATTLRQVRPQQARPKCQQIVRDSISIHTSTCFQTVSLQTEIDSAHVTDGAIPGHFRFVQFIREHWSGPRRSGITGCGSDALFGAAIVDLVAPPSWSSRRVARSKLACEIGADNANQQACGRSARVAQSVSRRTGRIRDRSSAVDPINAARLLTGRAPLSPSCCELIQARGSNQWHNRLPTQEH